MNEQWMEEIKHNDAVIFLEKYFPGKLFGDKTEQIAELCRIAEKSGFTDSESIRKIVSVQIGEDAMPLHDETIAPDGRRIIGKKSISDAHSKNGTCKECLEYAGRIFKIPEEADQMPVLPRHPNCKCHYEDVYEKGTALFFRVKGSPGKYGLFGGGIEFDGIEDLISYLEKNNYPPHSIDELAISNHSGLDNSYPMGKADNLRFITDNQLQRIKFFLHKDSVVDIRMCSAASGEDGKKTAQKIANKLGCKVIAYAGPVSPSGTRALILPKETDLPITKRILPDNKPGIFLPKVDKL